MSASTPAPLTLKGAPLDTDPANPDAPPKTKEQLRAWLLQNLRLSFPEHPLIPAHNTPLDYLAHSFLSDYVMVPPVTGPEVTGALVPRIPSTPLDSIIWANRGGGKTFLGAVATALDLLFKPGIEIRILGGSLEQSSKMHRYLRQLFDLPALKPHLKGRITERQITLQSGARVELLAQSEASVRGTRVQKLRCDEVELFDPAVWEAAQLTTRSERRGDWLLRGSIECFSTMHRAHGLMSRLIAECHAGKRTLFRWGMLDVLETCPTHRACESCSLNPECRGRAKNRTGGHLAIDDAVQQKSRVGKQTWEAEMLSLRAQRTDAVFPEFDRARHVYQGPPPGGGAWFAGMDFGFRAPTVILWAHLDDKNVLRITEEHVLAGAILDHHIQVIKQPHRPALAWIAIDNAGKQVNAHSGQTSADLLRAAGLTVKSRAQQIRAGLPLIHARLAPADNSPPRLLIHHSCTHLQRALEEYHYDPSNPHSDQPIKDGQNDHHIDALRYLIHALDLPHDLNENNYLGYH